MAIDITGTNGDDVINDTSALNGEGTASPNASVNISGLSGFDKIYGSFNKDTLYGNAGNDLILGNGGSDTIFGGQGNDTLYITGTNGDVTTEPALAVRSKVVGGMGQDTVRVGGGTGARNSEDGFGGRFIGQVTVFGGSESADREDQGDLIDVRLDGNSYAEIYSNGGNDTVSLNGVDRPNAGEVASRFFVHGGQGNDQVMGAAGANSTIYGGVGADEIEVQALNAVTVYGGNGNVDAVDGNDQIRVTIGNDAFVADGTVPTALIAGNGGNDYIQLETGGDGVQASIYGGQGTDFILAGNLASNSYVAGGVGSDILFVDLNGRDGDADAAAKNVSVFGGNGSNDPNDGVDVIIANLGREATAQIFGNGGDDFLVVSGPGSATVYGGAGDDTFFVNAGNNDQDGLPQSVVLTGGIGSDLYDISASGQGEEGNRTSGPIVRISDFNFDEDRIVGSDVDSVIRVTNVANNFDELADLANANVTDDTAALIVVQTGALAGAYLAYENDGDVQIINVTGYSGTVDADIFQGSNALPIGF